MILAESFKCTVPSANAVKEASITCVTGATNWPDIWMAFGSIGGAIATTAAVLVALHQSRTAKNMAREAQELAMAQHDEAKQLPALNAYVSAWRAITKIPAPSSKPKTYVLIRDATEAGRIWRDANRRTSENRSYLDDLENLIVRCLYELEFNSKAHVSDWALDRSGLSKAVEDLTRLAVEWQTDASIDRAKTNRFAKDCYENCEGYFLQFKEDLEQGVIRPRA